MGIEMNRKLRRGACVLVVFAMVAGFVPAGSQAWAKAFKKDKPKGAMATAVNSEIAVTWESVKNAKGYQVYESINGEPFKRVAVTKNTKVCRPAEVKGGRYRYRIRGYQVKVVTVKVDPAREQGKTAGAAGAADPKAAATASSTARSATSKKTGDAKASSTKPQTRKVKKYTYSRWSRIAYTTAPTTGKSTLKNYLRDAIMPLGHTVYIWGGGWNKADTGSGMTTRRTGLYKTWRTYANKQSRWYNYLLHRYEINKGLDCSGFVGWTVYNVMHTRNNKPGYVYLANVEGQKYAKMGLGVWTNRNRVTDHIPGDIMEGDEHIWISLGQCKDGSTVVLHASPPGVKLSGTASRTGARNSQAASLAAKYMKKYYPSWYSRYPDATLWSARSYNEDYNRFRWYANVLSDPEGYRSMSADQVLADLFSEM